MMRKSFLFFSVAATQVAGLVHNTDAALHKELIIPEYKFASYPPEGDLSGKYVNNELVDKVYEQLKNILSPDVLNIPVNRIDPDMFCSVIKSEEYNRGKANYCYWQDDTCVRTEATVNYDKDQTHCEKDNVWAMTFDDGPNDGSLTSGIGTNQILDQLDAINKKATFFLVGSNIMNTPGGVDVVQRIVAKGHRIGAHTWSHSPSTALTNKQLIAEFLYTESAIAEATKNQVRPSIWRPPCGDIDDRVRAIASALGYTTVIWTSHPSRDTSDSLIGWKSTEKKISDVVYNVKTWFDNEKKLGFIALQHDVSPASLEVAMRIFQYIKNEPPESPVHNSVPLNICSPEIPDKSLVRGGPGLAPIVVGNPSHDNEGYGANKEGHDDNETHDNEGHDNNEGGGHPGKGHDNDDDETHKKNVVDFVPKKARPLGVNNGRIVPSVPSSIPTVSAKTRIVRPEFL